MPTETERLRDQVVEAAVKWREARRSWHNAVTPPEALTRLDLAVEAYEAAMTLDGPVASGKRETSREAALRTFPSAKSMRGAILDVVVSRLERGLTCSEAELMFSKSHQTISPRIYELHRGGWIIDSGERRTTRSGSPETVWIASAATIRHLGLN